MRYLLPCTLLLLFRHYVLGWCPLFQSKRLKSRAPTTTLSRLPALDAAARQRRDNVDSYYDTDDDDDDSYWQQQDKNKQSPPPLDYKVDMDALDQDNNDDKESKQQQQQQQQQEATGSGVYYYQVSFDGHYDHDELALDWEECDDGTMVLLPPPYVSTPRSIIHFCGGTFFGSSPKLWYRTLLEGIVRATQSVVVATPIPVTLLKSPLQHVRISRKLQHQFQKAYINVVEDEYGIQALEDVPVIGMGHSLGARLLTVLATLDDKPSSRYSDIPPYQAYILISFTNYNSAASIPGIQSLLNQSKRLENNNREDEFIQERKKRSRSFDYDEDDEDYDEEWEELMQDFTATFREQASRIKHTLTPASKELEFHPTPSQLWNALQKDHRYTIPHTLLVQFELDTIDQSPRLAESLLESTDIKYARLKGVHLTPVSATSETSRDDDNPGLFQLSAKASNALWKLVRGKQTLRSIDELRDLRQSIARYITDVVADSAVKSSRESAHDENTRVKQETTTSEQTRE